MRQATVAPSRENFLWITEGYPKTRYCFFFLFPGSSQEEIRAFQLYFGVLGHWPMPCQIGCVLFSNRDIAYTIHILNYVFMCAYQRLPKKILCLFVFNCMCASSGFPGRQINDACAISAQLSLILASSQFSSIQTQIKYISNLHKYKALKYISFKYTFCLFCLFVLVKLQDPLQLLQ